MRNNATMRYPDVYNMYTIVQIAVKELVFMLVAGAHQFTSKKGSIHEPVASMLARIAIWLSIEEFCHHKASKDIEFQSEIRYRGPNFF